MVLIKNADGSIIYKFYRKNYRKARYRRRAERQKVFLDRNYSGWHGIVIW